MPTTFNVARLRARRAASPTSTVRHPMILLAVAVVLVWFTLLFLLIRAIVPPPADVVASSIAGYCYDIKVAERADTIEVSCLLDDYVSSTGKSNVATLAACTALIPKAFSVYRDARFVRFSTYATTVDAYGNIGSEHVMTIGFSRSTANDVRWQTVPVRTLPIIADEYR